MSKVSKNKVLDLGLSHLGGFPSCYARNISRNGDYAKIAHIIGLDEKRVLIDMVDEFNTPEFIEQIKVFLLKSNEDILFANDQPHGLFIDPTAVINKTKEMYKLMSFEVESIEKDLSMMHRIYLNVITKVDSKDVPNRMKYIAGDSLYPIIQTAAAIKAVI